MLDQCVPALKLQGRTHTEGQFPSFGWGVGRTNEGKWDSQAVISRDTEQRCSDVSRSYRTIPGGFLDWDMEDRAWVVHDRGRWVIGETSCQEDLSQC